ncbi:restriction endonuclease subunit S [Escherichia coli]|uniref:restriction endonuclease subunit S n=1 Tax=Escherichia coli TaxID=562 RepID=UPI000DD73275|nr:restriction endonuclease subunit S [Escherichia coli]HCJ5844720.1 restriction endonuclease subunit S [Escherichia coli]HCJ9262560.1 restriction endonuclease subunit S [Escherichia coli]HCJ9868174.1 restriction endonuclease subunit S [Escherichia coli]
MSEMSYLEKLLDGVEVEWKTLGQTCKIETGKLNANAAVDDGEYMFFTTAKETSKIDKFRWDTEALLIAGNANVGEVKHYIGKFEAYQRTYVLTNFDENVSVRFLYFVLSHSLKKYLEERTNSAAMTYIVLSTLENFPIPIPCPDNPEKSLAIQSEIVRILDKFTALTAELTAELNMRKKQYNYYRDQLLSFDEEQEKPIYLEKLLDGVEVEWLPLGEITKYEQPTKYLVKAKDYHDTYTIPVLTAGKTFILGYTNETHGIYQASKAPVIIFDDFTTANKWVDFDFKAKSSAMKMVTSCDDNKTLLKYVYYWLNTLPSEFAEGDHKRQWISNYSQKKIPIPCPDNPEKSLAIQSEIVRILDKFDTLTNSITEGLPREIELRQKQYEYYRDLLFSFPKPETVSN